MESWKSFKFTYSRGRWKILGILCIKAIWRNAIFLLPRFIEVRCSGILVGPFAQALPGGYQMIWAVNLLKVSVAGLNSSWRWNLMHCCFLMLFQLWAHPLCFGAKCDIYQMLSNRLWWSTKGTQVVSALRRAFPAATAALQRKIDQNPFDWAGWSRNMSP